MIIKKREPPPAPIIALIIWDNMVSVQYEEITIVTEVYRILHPKDLNWNSQSLWIILNILYNSILFFYAKEGVTLGSSIRNMKYALITTNNLEFLLSNIYIITFICFKLAFSAIYKHHINYFLSLSLCSVYRAYRNFQFFL